MLKPYTTVHGHEVFVERRRYPGTTYTWAYIKLDGEYVGLGDPWPCINPPRKQLAAAIKYVTDVVPDPSQLLAAFLPLEA